MIWFPASIAWCGRQTLFIIIIISEEVNRTRCCVCDVTIPSIFLCFRPLFLRLDRSGRAAPMKNRAEIKRVRKSKERRGGKDEAVLQCVKNKAVRNCLRVLLCSFALRSFHYVYLRQVKTKICESSWNAGMRWITAYRRLRVSATLLHWGAYALRGPRTAISSSTFFSLVRSTYTCISYLYLPQIKPIYPSDTCSSFPSLYAHYYVLFFFFSLLCYAF